MGQFFSEVAQAVAFHIPQDIWKSILGAFKALNMQLDLWGWTSVSAHWRLKLITCVLITQSMGDGAGEVRTQIM